MNKLIIAVLLVALAGGGYYVYSQNEAQVATDATATEDMGTYAYACENGSQFTMTPSADVSEITLTAGSQGMFTGTARLARMGDGVHFETTSGQLITFGGAGEEVQLTVGSETTVCNPVPNADMAPWNWGDAGEGGGSVQPDVRLVVGESIMGKWQSTDDAKFVREFKAFSETSLTGTVTDWHDGKQVSTGTYVMFNSENALTVPFPLMSDKVYIQMTMQGTQAEKLNFSLNKLTPEELELTYMDRGGVLKFKAIQ